MKKSGSTPLYRIEDSDITLSNWLEFVKSRSTLSVFAHQEKANVISLEELYFIEKEFKGGECDNENCRKPWKKIKTEVEINKKKITHTFYQPSCTCYPRCFVCGRYLIIELKKELPGCRYCFGSAALTCNRWIKRGRAKCNGVLELKDKYGWYECNTCGKRVLPENNYLTGEVDEEKSD